MNPAEVRLEIAKAMARKRVLENKLQALMRLFPSRNWQDAMTEIQQCVSEIANLRQCM